MTTACRSTFAQRMRAALVEDDTRIPVILGLCGAGRTTLLHQLEAGIAPGTCQYVNVERTATTPERFLKALASASPFPEAREVQVPASPRAAFDAVLAFFSGARCTDGSRATFLLDEVMEFRTFESFPGLRRALPEVLAVIASTPNRFALTSRYVTRSERALSTASPHFLVAPMQAMSAGEVDAMLGGQSCGSARAEAPGSDLVAQGSGVAGQGSERVAQGSDLAETVLSLAGGRPSYARALAETMTASARRDPVAALTVCLEPGGRLSTLCGHSYELRLHRARGYGALKAILEILCEAEPLTLTEISQRLGRTPGSTKDYLSWLDDVDLVSVNRKRYRFRDPLMRTWCRLHCRTQEPSAEEIAREVRLYAESSLGAGAAGSTQQTAGSRQ